jgi:hypothetical protein
MIMVITQGIDSIRPSTRPSTRPSGASGSERGGMRGMGAVLGLAVLGAVLGAACGGPDKPTNRPAIAGTQPDGTTPDGQESPVPPGGAVEVSGTGATETEAYDQALAMLEARIYGEDPWARELELPVHDRERDLFRREEAGNGRIRVVLGLQRERVEALLQELTTQPLPAAVPAALADALGSAHGLFMEALACQRRQELLGEQCEAPSREDIAAEVQAVARETRLRTRLTGGIPLDGGNRPLRPLEVVVERVSSRGVATPLPGVPVMAVQPDGVDALRDTAAVTDPAGQARFELRAGAAWPNGVRIALDAAAFLGPLAEMWPRSELAPAAHPASLKRWGLIVTERVQGNQARQAVFAASLDRALRAGGNEPMLALPDAIVRRIKAAAPNNLAKLLPTLADELQGRLDRVWYEARGRAQVYDVWTGKRLAELQDAVTATGVGDERADQTARSDLAGKLAAELAKVPAVVQ